MNSKQLQYAIELSKSLSFSVVAKKMHISQPALSKHISNLEKEVGIELFDRSTNPVTLTAAGEYFLNEAEKLLYREEQLYRSMDDFKSGKRGNLIIGISPFRSLYLINDMLKKVKEKYPDVKIILNEDSSDVIKANIVEGKYDFAIANLPVEESLLDVDFLEQDKLVLVVPDSMVSLITSENKENLSKINFKDCKKLPFITLGQMQEMRILFERICSLFNIKPKITMEVGGLTSAWSMARAGMGATILPLQFVEKMDSNAPVRLYIPDCEMNMRQPAILTRRDQYLSEYARYAIKILKS